MSEDPSYLSLPTDADPSSRPQLSPGEFTTRIINDDPALMTLSYRLRYRVYCVERGFLPAADYPERLETDQFDRYAKHLGTFDGEGEMVGTARLVFPSLLGLPLFHHCSVFHNETELYDPRNSVVEISRLSVSRPHRSRRSRNDESDALAAMDRVRARNDEVVFSLYRGLYQASKRAGLTHWVVATEASLQRAVAGYGFPFRAIGPEIDYFGPVTPYIMDLSGWDRIILSGTMPRLDGFLDGLDEPHKPRPSERWLGAALGRV